MTSSALHLAVLIAPMLASCAAGDGVAILDASMRRDAGGDAVDSPLCRESGMTCAVSVDCCSPLICVSNHCVDVDAGVPGDAGPSCIATSCGTCTPMSSCGWCESTHACQAGSSTGPTVATCADWRYVPSECTSSDGGPAVDAGRPCVASTCEACTVMGACGWCSGTISCRTGGRAGPDGGCSGWRWLSSECSSP